LILINSKLIKIEVSRGKKMLRQLLASSVTALKQQQPSPRLFARQLVQPALQQQTAGYASSDAKEDKPFKGTGYTLYFQVRFVAPGCSLSLH